MNRELTYKGNALRFGCETADGKAVITLGESKFEIVLNELSRGRMILNHAHGASHAYVVRERDKIFVWLSGKVFEFQLPKTDHDGGDHGAEAGGDVRAPMPGTLVKLMVAVGDVVEQGQLVAIVEAMKMEHSLRAPRKGKVQSTYGEQGKVVDTEQVIVSIAEETA